MMIEKLLGLGCVLALAMGCAGPGAPTPPERNTAFDRVGSYLEAGDPEQALQELLKYPPRSRGEQILAARLCIQTGRLSEARQRLTVLENDSPGEAEILYLLFLVEQQAGNPDTGEAYLAAALAADPSHSDASASRGRLYLEEGSIEQARMAFDRALAGDPYHLEALLGSGQLLFGEERYPEALEVLDRAVGAAPAFPFAYQDRARIRSALGDEAGALEDLNTAVRIEPAYYWSRLDRGRLLLRLGHRDEAGVDFERAVELDPDNFLAYVYSAGIHEERQDFARAIADYETLLRLRPDYFFALESLAVLYYSTEQWQSSARRFTEAFDNSWDEPSYALLAALARRQAGQDPAAFLQSRRARIQPDSWAYPLARYLSGEAGEAVILDLAQRETNAVVRARILFYVGCTFLMDGQSPSALVYLSEAAQELPPHWAEARIARELCDRGGM
jgi:tetratricopeptide (TPR) repeat protein